MQRKMFAYQLPVDFIKEEMLNMLQLRFIHQFQLFQDILLSNEPSVIAISNQETVKSV